MKRGVPVRERLPGERTEAQLDWQLLRLFLELRRAGSFRAAAERLALSTNTVRRRVEELEAVLGVSLFTRHVDGVRPTPESERILDSALAMEEAAFSVLRARDTLGSDVSGDVRIAVTEGLGSVWLTPRLAEFQQQHPQLRIDMNCGLSSADVLRMEADIAIQLTRPTAVDLKIIRLGYLHSMPFASRNYIAKYGSPQSVRDLADHRLILQVAEHTGQSTLFQSAIPDMDRAPFVPFTSNASTVHGLAIANGMGIGWLPTYIHSLQLGIIPIDCGVNFQFDIWLTYHPDTVRVPRVRQMIDWLRACFDGRRYPFFRKEWIHPNDLPILDKHLPLSQFYRGYIP
ncbi:LysR family transcriptional regulator [Methylobacterium sp. J-072]|uniref:LysR family transcriptional regulator n=1 Tax=Methylobacterium sp. J-072 TaxID=2836651 RepID=UPI001FB9B982|nr:LysR family transcriptional regulator [Methylobacterium sp. J-072]MCJ2092261.1 LysR family transcriptional regulator [Methylobacterium sp. J-072]